MMKRSSSEDTFNPPCRGTTIVGIICEEQGVVLASDRRLTTGIDVNDTDSRKIFKITPKIWCCGSGIIGHASNLANQFCSLLEEESKYNNREIPFKEVLKRMTDYIRSRPRVYDFQLILGGVDSSGPHLCEIFKDGTCHEVTIAACGSGGPYARVVLQEESKKRLTMSDGERTVVRAVQSGIEFDIHSGGNVDVCRIPVNCMAAEYIRDHTINSNIEPPCKHMFGEADAIVERIYGIALPELKDGIKPVIRMLLGLQMIEDLVYRGFDGFTVAHNFSKLEHVRYSKKLQYLCNMGFRVLNSTSADVNTQREIHRNHEREIKTCPIDKVQEYLTVGMRAYADFYHSRWMLKSDSQLTQEVYDKADTLMRGFKKAEYTTMGSSGMTRHNRSPTQSFNHLLMRTVPNSLLKEETVEPDEIGEASSIDIDDHY